LKTLLDDSWRVFYSMTYKRLTKEQFEELHEAFSQFLASQSIDATQWDQMKADAPELVSNQLDAFSDLVWTEVLRKAVFLDHFSEDGLFCFHAGQKSLRLVGVRCQSPLDLTDASGWSWLKDHWQEDQVSFYSAQKPYESDRAKELFGLIEKGAVLSNGSYFEALERLGLS